MRGRLPGAHRPSLTGLPKSPISGDRPLSIENWLYKTLNPVMKALLRSPLHGIASGTIALLHFRGRKSGREFVTPLSYVRENGTVCFLSAHSTRWWMNLREEGVPVSIEIARETYTGRARLWDGDSEELRERVRLRRRYGYVRRRLHNTFDRERPGFRS